ncbi:hypothetical protein PtB15_9B122 [Puccinia triticina]|nr:hypothetical protein PtB15_9B122 [Puccinia triticina]
MPATPQAGSNTITSTSSHDHQRYEPSERIQIEKKNMDPNTNSTQQRSAEDIPPPGPGGPPGNNQPPPPPPPLNETFPPGEDRLGPMVILLVDPGSFQILNLAQVPVELRGDALDIMRLLRAMDQYEVPPAPRARIPNLSDLTLIEPMIQTLEPDDQVTVRTFFSDAHAAITARLILPRSTWKYNAGEEMGVAFGDIAPLHRVFAALTSEAMSHMTSSLAYLATSVITSTSLVLMNGYEVL